MSLSFGTGQPIVLKCAKCKVGGWRRGMNLEATGEFKKEGYGQKLRRSPLKVRYRCLDCRHVGWTRHVDGERLLARVIGEGEVEKLVKI